MKKTTLITLMSFIFCAIFNSNAQTEFITGLNNPVGIFLNQDNLYIANNGSGNILKADLSKTPPELTTIATGLKNPARIIMNNDDLYISEYEGNRILKLNLSSESPEIEEVLTGLNAPDGMAVINENLYFVEYGKGTLSKIDLNEASPTVTEIIRNLEGPREIIFYKEELYITESNGGLISKINLDTGNQSHTDVITGLTSCYGFTIKNDNIFLTQRSLNQVTRVNLNNLQTEVILSNINECVSVAINENETILYVSSYSDNTIYKYEDSNLSIEDKPFEKRLLLYPNPVQSQIQFKNLSSLTAYKLFNIQGQQISKGELLPKQTLNVNFLNPGLYFLKTESETFRFIKQ